MILKTVFIYIIIYSFFNSFLKKIDLIKDIFLINLFKSNIFYDSILNAHSVNLTPQFFLQV